MTWLELYNFLNEQANSIHNIGQFDWNKTVTIHNVETGDEYGCDTFYIDNDTNKKLVLMINIDQV